MLKISARYYLLDASNKSGKLFPISGERARRLKSVLTYMLYDFQTRCELNGITPFLVYGSALGAYRHKGFIPWDDDVDVAMTRDDWNHLKTIFEDVFSDKYELEGPNYGNKDAAVTWGKIFLKGTKFVELININTPYNKGIYLDIFIIDGMADNKLIRTFDYTFARCMRFVANSLAYYNYPSDLMNEIMSVSWNTKIYLWSRKLIGFMFSWISHKRLISFFDRFVSRHTNSKDTIIDYYDGITRRGAWFPVKKTPFETILANVPPNLEEFLESVYGKDYMKLPPENQRQHHFCVELDFGETRLSV